MNHLFAIILSVVVSASIDSTAIWVGDQTQLHLQATKEVNDTLLFPQYGTELTDGIEIVRTSPIDTILQKDGRLALRQSLTLTSFADSLFFIEPIAFVANGDTVRTNPLSLNVIQPFETDSTDQAITDIKPIYKAPVWWWGILRWILLGLGIIGLCAGGYFLYRYIVSHKKEQQETVNPELLRPADEVALEKLDKIKAEKIWQQGQLKEYHTQLTDVLREYIARRYEIGSQEMTSEEIISAVSPLFTEQKDLLSGLQSVLRLADLVKFAKWHATAEENETGLSFSYRFVRETTPAEEPATTELSQDTTEQTITENTIADENSTNKR